MPPTDTESTQTHFGYQTIAKNKKNQLIAEVFDSVAAKYNLMNDLMSCGIHRLWKRLTIELSGVRKGHRVLDLAAGTGDISKLLANRVGPSGQIVCSDINATMLNVGRDLFINRGFTQSIQYAQINAETLPFPSNTFDCITMSFGLRNTTDPKAVLAEMERTLKPTGRAIILEFSKPTNAMLRKLYRQYCFSVLPRLGQWIVNDALSYRYLAESIQVHPDQDTLKQMVLDVGFKHCDYYNFNGGIVAVHRAFKAQKNYTHSESGFSGLRSLNESP